MRVAAGLQRNDVKLHSIDVGVQWNDVNRPRVDFSLQRPGSTGSGSLPACRERWRFAVNRVQLAVNQSAVGQMKREHLQASAAIARHLSP
jgi:hypothetical protein